MKFSDLLEPVEPKLKIPVEKKEVVKEAEIVPVEKKVKEEKVDLDRAIYVEFHNKILEILKAVDKIIFLASKRKIGMNLLKALMDLSVAVIAYRKYLSNRNFLTSGGTAQRILRNERKFNQLIVSQFIPFLGGNDRTLTAEFLNKWNEKT